MNPEQLLAHLKRLTATLSAKQLATLAIVFVAVVGVVVGSAYWINTPTYTLLFSDLDSESASSVVNKLKNDKIAYTLDEGGRSIRVASDRVDELRLGFASSGMPSSGRIGFEIFDRTAFGTTEFLEHVNYRRALEGELARTIGTIAEVSSARVHIAMAKESLMVGDSQPAKASVVLKLRNNKPLAPATVAGISSLVAASVESLRPESVVIVDTFGRPLSRQQEDADDPGSALQFDKQRRVERDLTAKVVSLLEPVVGQGHARVNVSVNLSGDSEEQTEEKYDPETVVRSKQTTSDSGGTMVAQGVAGARANAPPNTSTAGAPAATTTPQVASRMTESTTYEVSKLTRHRILPRGQVTRMSVAVIVDDERVSTKNDKGQMQVTNKPRQAADLQRLQGLVSAAIGIDADRGDQVTVENIAFEEAPVEEPPATNWLTRTVPQLKSVGTSTFVDLGRILAIIAIAWFAFAGVLKPMARRALEGPSNMVMQPALAKGSTRTIADLEGQIEAEIDAGLAAKVGETRRLPVLTKRIAKVAEQEPEHVARLVRSWLSDEER